ncbi:uncharacterized protein HMPREF1541_02678 [Cyphellophora europaea CBS 101466]|uniref:Sulfite oxidase n=1 Tax=Cyphellophora europaea (strain CBS 101466) TaxID=1220924 RepID=W2S6G6_CYPE1|nr:uncharacterized protein HMPREF1541_02678 [Cyphellophora europaea CBS 101466]ETN43519.1 hypothetical protein HMPREF1541_02678 [Cyphellophora europaea CBS 101466]
MTQLISSFLTCIEKTTYDRNHGPILHKSADQHRVVVDGLVSNPLELSLASLAHDFPQHTVTCALQCAGNRRHSMRTRIKEVSGVDWFDGALMNCVFEGPLVRDILLAAGVNEEPLQGRVRPGHVQFASFGSKTQEDDWYGGSIPFSRTMDPDMDVILALKMNGKPLPPRHGYPVRAIVPGVLGARSVKWLDRITASTDESPCFYQQHDYKVLPPEAVDMQVAEQFWSKTPAMLEMPVNACVATPKPESTITLPASGLVEVRGYAVPQGRSGPVVRVQVSGDEGVTWVDSLLEDGGDQASKWSWVLWSAKIKISPGKGRKIYAKATDAAGNTQEQPRSTWNVRGVAYK